MDGAVVEAYAVKGTLVDVLEKAAESMKGVATELLKDKGNVHYFTHQSPCYLFNVVSKDWTWKDCTCVT